MREVGAASAVVILETKEVAESWQSPFPTHPGGLYPLCRHRICRKG